MSKETEGQYFRKALSQFVHEFASGDEIRKYADMGMSLRQIKERLSFPTPMEKIQEIVWNHYLSTKRILLEEPGKDVIEKYEYVREVSSYGRTSYRKVKMKEVEENVKWEKKRWNREDSQVLFPTAYVELFFGLVRYREEKQYQKMLACLSENEADFIDGLFQRRCKVYYRLDEQMQNILIKLDEKHLYEGMMIYKKPAEERYPFCNKNEGFLSYQSFHAGHIFRGN